VLLFLCRILADSQLALLEKKMRNVTKTAIAGSLALLAGSVQALPQFAANNANDIYFNSLENAYRTAANCAAFGGCLGFDAANDPAGWQRANPALANNLMPGDVLVSIVRTQNIDPLWNSAPGDRFNGYLAQEIKAIDPVTYFPSVALRLDNPTVDPFGVLKPGESLRMYAGPYNFTSATAGTTFGMIAGVTGDPFWGSFGLDGTKNTYSYNIDNPLLPGTQTKDEFFTAWNLVTKGGAYNAGNLLLVNDLNESEHGTINPSFLCTGADVADPAISCSQIVGTAEIEFNKNSSVGGVGLSPWIYSANDPLSIFVPEPGSLALLGLGLTGLALRRRSA